MAQEGRCDEGFLGQLKFIGKSSPESNPCKGIAAGNCHKQGLQSRTSDKKAEITFFFFFSASIS